MTAIVTQETFTLAFHAACPSLAISGRSKTHDPMKDLDFSEAIRLIHAASRCFLTIVCYACRPNLWDIFLRSSSYTFQFYQNH
jgi:hypothetical protein